MTSAVAKSWEVSKARDRVVACKLNSGSGVEMTEGEGGLWTVKYKKDTGRR